MSDHFNELATDLMRLSESFGLHRMTMVAIDLGSWENGQTLIGLLDKEHRMYLELGIHPKTGEACNQCTIAGVIVRWPAMRQVVTDRYGNPTGFKYI